MTGRFLRGWVRFGIVVCLSGNWILASVMGSEEVILGPIPNGAVGVCRAALSYTELFDAGH